MKPMVHFRSLKWDLKGSFCLDQYRRVDFGVYNRGNKNRLPPFLSIQYKTIVLPIACGSRNKMIDSTIHFFSSMTSKGNNTFFCHLLPLSLTKQNIFTLNKSIEWLLFRTYHICQWKYMLKFKKRCKWNYHWEKFRTYWWNIVYAKAKNPNNGSHLLIQVNNMVSHGLLCFFREHIVFSFFFSSFLLLVLTKFVLLFFLVLFL